MPSSAVVAAKSPTDRRPATAAVPLHILVVEDISTDAELMIIALREGGLEPTWKRVETAGEMRAALAAGQWDVVLSDYTMPEFGVAQALEIVRAFDEELPFIVVSGAVGEDLAVEVMRAGANDYVFKHTLTRLAPAIQREVREATNRRARRTAERTARHLAAIVESSEDAIISKTLDGVITSWNPAAERLHGWTAAEAIGQNVSFLVPPDKTSELGEILDRLRAGEQTEYIETVRLDRDGRRIDVALTISPVRDATGRLVGISKTARDIRERKRAEAALQSSQQRLRHVLASSPAVLFTLVVVDDQMQGIDWISDNVTEMLGYSPEDATAPDWWMRNIHPDDRDGAAAHTREAFLVPGSVIHEFRFRHHDGSYRWTRGELRLIRDAAGRPVEAVGSWSDITERKQLEDQVRQSQKMEAVGQLASGVAHDFNNLLTIINGYSDLLLQSLPPADPSRDMIAEIQKAGQRSAGLTRQLLAFSRKQVLAPRVIDLNWVVTDTEKMLRRLTGEDIRFTTTLDPALWVVRADPGQVEQVLMNLVVNAHDAMPQGGQLLIKTRNVELDEAYARSRPDARPGPYVLLSVTDTGTGMRPDVMARIFEPFFTTKGPGKGSGLGLATSYGIAKQSGGHIAVISEPGVGTTFNVYLPQAERIVDAASPRSRPKGKPGGTETILIVEDEAGVRALTRSILTGCGYKVLEATNGVEAVRVSTEHAGPIQLLIADVVMPGKCGRAVAEELVDLRRGMRVMYMSGYTNDAIVRHGIVRDAVNFLQKPFTPPDLAIKVRDVLDAPAEPKCT
jgi:two-component system cell cycle sensor histidine kinase/response regulator CckA